jgi:hypothetical protein
VEDEFTALVDVGLKMLSRLNFAGQELHRKLVGYQVLDRPL